MYAQTQIVVKILKLGNYRATGDAQAVSTSIIDYRV